MHNQSFPFDDDFYAYCTYAHALNVIELYGIEDVYDFFLVLFDNL